MLKSICSKLILQNSKSIFNFKHLRYSYYYYEHNSNDNYNNNYNYRDLKVRISICGFLLGSLLYYKHSKLSCKLGTVRAYCSTKSFTADEVRQHTTKETRIWVTYNNIVYDITEFVDKHPGGDKIYLAAGGGLEPYWSLYAIHKDNKEVLDILRQYEIGLLIGNPENETAAATDDPYNSDPKRHPALRVVSSKPCNAETPSELLTDSFLTPNSVFFVRNHLPVPHVDIEKFRLTFDGIGLENVKINLTLDEIKRIASPKSMDSTIMCAGNRRKDMFQHKPVRGLAWGYGAISTAKWTGISLVEFFAHYKLTYEDLVKMGAKHIHFEGLDTDPTGARYGASVPIEMALDPKADIMLVWQMNNEDLPPDHGYPLRVIIPGVVGARQVKWLTKIAVSDKESDSFWQKNDYKTFSPNVDFDTIDYSTMPPVMESNVQSAICVPRDGQTIRNEGCLNVKGYAWSGAGRGIIRVEISTDNGMTWIPATITQSKEVPTSSLINRKQWCWTLWEIDLPIADDCGELEILCKAVDSSQNTQPESYKGTWNVRGLMANAWHKITIKLINV